MEQFDPNLPGLMQGKVTVKVIDPTEYPPLEVPNHVLDPTKPFDILVRWELSGRLVPLWLQALGGNWNVQVFVDPIGPEPEKLLARKDDVAADPTVAIYEAKLTVPANTLHEGNPGSDISGFYKLVTSVFLNSTLENLGHYDLVGFAEGPIIQMEHLA